MTRYLLQHKKRQHPKCCKEKGATKELRYPEEPNLCKACFYQHKTNPCKYKLHYQHKNGCYNCCQIPCLCNTPREKRGNSKGGKEVEFHHPGPFYQGQVSS